MRSPRITRRAACACVALGAALLAGCATVAPPPPVTGPRFSGRLAVNVPAHEGQPARGFNAQFDLQGTAERGELQLATPLGSVLAQARWQPQGAEVQTPQGRASYPDLEAMTAALVGQALPLAALIDWLQQRPWPGAASVRTDAGFAQLGWSVHWPGGDPALLVAAKQDAPQVQVRVRLDR